MELKSKLLKPYSEKERLNFIVGFNHLKGYTIKETETALEAWGYTEEEKKQAEKERIALLSLTKREVFLALYKAKGITPEQIKTQITDTEALIEFEYANEYYRGNPLIDLIGAKLGYTSDDLDYLFENKELPAKALEADADQAEDLNPSAVKFD